MAEGCPELSGLLFQFRGGSAEGSDLLPGGGAVGFRVSQGLFLPGNQGIQSGFPLELLPDFPKQSPRYVFRS